MSEPWATNPSCLPDIESPVGPKGPVGDPGPKAVVPDTPPLSEDWRNVTVIHGGNVYRGKAVSLEFPDFDTLSILMEDIAFSSASPGCAAVPDGDSP